MLTFLKELTSGDKAKVVQLISKLELHTDAGDQMPKLMELFAHRRIFLDLLLENDWSGLTIQQLLVVLHNLMPLDRQMISTCLKKRPEDWEIESMMLSGMSSSAVGVLGPKDVDEIKPLSLKSP